MVNLETVGGSIIEVHLRVTDQWPDLYGRGWVDALVHLYAHGEWVYADRDRRDGYSVVLFERHDVRWRHPTPRQIEDIRSLPACRASRSRFTRIAIRRCTRCRPAASGSRSSTAGISTSASRRAIGCACISCVARDGKRERPVNFESKASSYRKIAG
jgi:hypothetical protein